MSLRAEKPSWGTKALESMNDICAALGYLDLPVPDRGAIEAISLSPEKTKFKLAIVECLGIHGAHPKAETVSYLHGLVHTISPQTVEAVNVQLGYENIPIKIFVQVGLEKGLAFHNAVMAAISSDDPAHDVSVTAVFEILNDVVSRKGGSIGFDSAPVTSRRSASVRSKQVTILPARSEQKLTPKSTEVARNSSEHDEDDALRSDYYSTHVYSKDASLCFNAVKSEKNHHTVMVDAAPSLSAKKYDWTRAIKFQIGHKELPLLYGVLVGWRNSVKFMHKTEVDKYFEIERQTGKDNKEGHFYVKMSAMGQGHRNLPISSMDAYPIMMLVLGQIIKEAPPELRGHPEIIIRSMKAAQTIGVV